jgi:GTP-binding protein
MISGRGELHLAILIETMRREGYEMQVSKPEVIVKKEKDQMLEPYEELTIDVPQEYIGEVTSELGQRKCQMITMHHDDRGRVKTIYHAAQRNLMGARNALLTKTKGTIGYFTYFLGYRPMGSKMDRIRNGVLIADESGTSRSYGLGNAQARGTLFIGAGIEVYEGMIVGLNTRDFNIEINVCKEKKQTNVRSETADIAIQITPPAIMSLEQCLDFLEEDELLEVTPKNLRLRKKLLGKVERMRASRK